VSLPTVTLTGTLTADPDLRFTNSGKAVASINVATNSRRKNPTTGQYEDGDTTFVRGSVWGQYAENVAESLTKGTKVIVTGQLKQRSYDKEGVTRTVFELDVDEIGPSLRFATAQVSRSGAKAAAAAPAGGWAATADDSPGW
jgi:single-strand DNA-binding protein